MMTSMYYMGLYWRRASVWLYDWWIFYILDMPDILDSLEDGQDMIHMGVVKNLPTLLMSQYDTSKSYVRPIGL